MELLELLHNDFDYNLLKQISDEFYIIEKQISALEINKLFYGSSDECNCFIDIQSGSGGTEAQDWADMLFRMYTRYCERKNFEVVIVEQQDGDVAGIKSVTLSVMGLHAYGYLRTEAGVHRLIRNSPFDAKHKRHTSFASVFVYPDISDDIVVDLNMSDVRIDTYRASGAGGQHINKTDSAIRLTYLPTGTVVQCQSDRSQHRNKEQAIKLLKAKLYELEQQKQQLEKKELENSKSDIGWGHQIRSYVFDQSRIKDLRTGHEINNVKSVMDGDIEDFILSALKMSV